MKAKSQASFDVITKLYNEHSDRFDFWTEPRTSDRSVDVMVPPAFATEFIRLLQRFDIDYRVKIADVQTYFPQDYLILS